uniref:Uncharacterized protein n=1 Tax=Romanomermis culicivorax TaxID=13658 RepID=A0A915J9Z2_ROMCU
MRKTLSISAFIGMIVICDPLRRGMCSGRLVFKLDLHQIAYYAKYPGSSSVNFSIKRLASICSNA